MNGAQPINALYTLWPSRFSRQATERGDRAISKYVGLARKYNLTPALPSFKKYSALAL